MLTSGILLFFCLVLRLLSSQLVFQIQSQLTLSPLYTVLQRLDFELRDAVSFGLLYVFSETEVSDEQSLIFRINENIVGVDVSVD